MASETFRERWTIVGAAWPSFLASVHVPTPAQIHGLDGMEKMWYFVGRSAMSESERERMEGIGEMSRMALELYSGSSVARERGHSRRFEYKRVKRMGLDPPWPERLP